MIDSSYYHEKFTSYIRCWLCSALPLWSFWLVSEYVDPPPPRVHTADPLLHRNAYAITSTEVWGIWKKIFTSCATTPRLITWRALRWRFSLIWERRPLVSVVCRVKWVNVNPLSMCVRVCPQLQIYEDSIVIKSVFESARERIVTNEQQKEAVSTSHNDNGGAAEDGFIPSAGESQRSMRRKRKTARKMK